jgi:hypothetical protein
MVTAVRALLRFLRVAGRVPVSLAGAVPSVEGWRRCLTGWLPDRSSRCWKAATGDRVVARRDYAILVLLARLGLRGPEVAAVETGDIGVRATGSSGCLCLWMSVRRWPTMRPQAGRNLAAACAVVTDAESSRPPEQPERRVDGQPRPSTRLFDRRASP